MTNRDWVDDPNHFAVQSFLNLRERDARDEAQCYRAEGIRALLTAADCGASIREILTSPTLLRSGPARRVIARYQRTGTRVTTVSPELYRRVSEERRASGVLAVLDQRWTDVAAALHACSFWVGVRHLRSAGNFGTLIRSVEGMGFGVMLFGATMDPYDPDVVGTSMCSVLSCPLVRTTHARLKEQEVHVVGAAVDGEPVFDVALDGPTVVLLGHERHGLTDEERAMSHQLARIPMSGSATSLNAGVAGSIFAYEAVRQRYGTPP